MTVFGRIITDDQVEDAVMTCLKRWTSTELAEIERQLSLPQGYYTRPRSWEVRNEFDAWPEDQMPRVIVISTGLAEDPIKESRGLYRVKYAVGVAVIASSLSLIDTRRYTYRLTAAVRTVLLHRQSLDKALDGTVRGIDWIDGRNNDLPPEDGRFIAASRQLFSVEVGNVVTQNAGPPEPIPEPTIPVPDPTPEDPHPEWPTIPDREHIHVATTKEPIDA
jgi:hypothetical protein